jgi:hypothetical protein
VFPVPSNQCLPFLKIADYWSREMKRPANRDEFFDSLVKACRRVKSPFSIQRLSLREQAVGDRSFQDGQMPRRYRRRLRQHRRS